MARPKKPGRPFTNEDDAFILSHLETLSIREIATELGRVRGSVWGRLKRLDKQGLVPETSFLEARDVAILKSCSVDTVHRAVRDKEIIPFRDEPYRFWKREIETWTPLRLEDEPIVHFSVNLPLSLHEWIKESAAKEGKSAEQFLISQLKGFISPKRRVRDRSEVIRKLYETETVPEVAKRVGLTKAAIYQCLKREGIPLKPRSKKEKPPKKERAPKPPRLPKIHGGLAERVLSLYETQPLSKVAKETGISPFTIRAFLVGQGVPIRKKPATPKPPKPTHEWCNNPRHEGENPVPVALMNLLKTKSDGSSRDCKACSFRDRKERKKERDRQKWLETKKRYHEDDEFRAQVLETDKQYKTKKRIEDPESVNARQREYDAWRYQNDPSFRQMKIEASRRYQEKKRQKG